MLKPPKRTESWFLFIWMKYVVRNKTKMCEMKISKSELTETLNQHCFKISYLLGLTVYDADVYDVPSKSMYDQNVPFCIKTSQVYWAGYDSNTNNIEQILTVCVFHLSIFCSDHLLSFVSATTCSSSLSIASYDTKTNNIEKLLILCCILLEQVLF